MPGLQRLASRERPDDRRADSDVKVKIEIFIPHSFRYCGSRCFGHCRQYTNLWLPVNFFTRHKQRTLRSFNFFVDKMIEDVYSVDGLLKLKFG